MDKKIVFLINTLKVGGAAKMLKYVANLSTEFFRDVAIISLYDEVYDGTGLNQNIEVKCLGYNKINRIRRQFVMVPKTRSAINELCPDYLCAFISHVCFIGRLATLKNKEIKFISAERGDPFTESFLWKKIIKWTYLNSDYCFFQLDKARDFFGTRVAKKSFVIPNPVILNNQVKPYFGIRNKTIVSAGRFGFEKRYNDLIDAFNIVHRRYPDYKLIIYGDGPMSTSYKKQVAELNLKDYVCFPGYVDCFAQQIREDGIFVLSSLYEGIPNSLIEAMSVGIPCVATDCTPGGPAFLFKNGERGQLVPVKNYNALAAAIMKYIENPQFAMEKGKAALEILDQLNESEIQKKWVNAFKVIASHGN